MKIPPQRLQFTEGCVRVDGASGEGGGQIVRTACALSALTGLECQIREIRAGRRTPGLRPQHVTAVRGLARLCGARTSPLRVGQRELTFSPGAIQATRLELDTKTAGSVSLVFQGLLLASLGAPGPVELTLRGGTDVPGAPSCDFVTNVKLETLRRMGIEVAFHLVKRGYVPTGGGVVRARIAAPPPSLLPPLLLGDEATEAEGVWGVSHASAGRGGRREAERQKRVAERLLTEALHVPARIALDCPGTRSPGAGVVLWARTRNSLFGASALKRAGMRPEAVAEEAVQRLVRTYHARASTDPWMGDQLLPYMALTREPSVISVPRLTRHMTTCMWLIQQFLNVRFFCEEQGLRTLVHCRPGTDPAR